MKQQLNEPDLLHEVKLTDDEQNCVVYNGCAGFIQPKGYQTFLTSDTDWTLFFSIAHYDAMKIGLNLCVFLFIKSYETSSQNFFFPAEKQMEFGETIRKLQ